MSHPNIDLGAIRALNGSQAEAFEEFCVQLARTETPKQADFKRKGTPDAGVECYAVFADGSEWAWQSKYFDAFGSSQWHQIDESVKTALEKHPAIARYTICIPLNRADGRIPGKQSAMATWERYVLKWTAQARALGKTVEFDYWGQSEILNMLSKPEHTGRVRFWFDTYAFDQNWFDTQLKEAIKTAGPRYTAELNIQLPIAQEFEAFGRTPEYFVRLKELAKPIRESHKPFAYEKVAAKELEVSLTQLSEIVHKSLDWFHQLAAAPIGKLPFDTGVTYLIEAGEVLRQLQSQLVELESGHEPSDGNDNAYRSLRNRCYELGNAIDEAHIEVGQAQRVMESRVLVLSGSAGSGKTHLLCDITHKRLLANRPTVLFMGQRFHGTEAPWVQALQQVDLANATAEDFVGALETAAQIAGCRALLIVDALNEGTGKIIWPNGMAPFLERLDRSEWIGTVLSVRTSYEELVLPDSVREQAHRVLHQGFSGVEYNATREFFRHYELELPSTPLLAPEFCNPLFLRTLCKGLHDQGLTRLPRGFQGITAVFNLYLDAINTQLAKKLDYNPRKKLVHQALEAIAKELAQLEDRALPSETCADIIDSLLPGRSHSASLYQGLVTEGILVEEFGIDTVNSSQQEVAFIAYDRFADHLIAKTLLDRHLSNAEPEVVFSEHGPMCFLWDNEQWVPGRFGLIEALFIQVPERTKRELAALAPQLIQPRYAYCFYQSLIWRDTASFSDNTRTILNRFYTKDRDTRRILDVLLTVASIPNHYFNADFLDQQLTKRSMAERDSWWSVALHYLWKSHGSVDRLIDWADAISPSVALEPQALHLSALTITWFLTSSNRFLRDRSTKALVSLLNGRLDAAGKLIHHFATVDDPYIAERLYAVAYGIATLSYEVESVGKLADTVYQHVFATGTPPANILLRDYARGIIERAAYLGATLDFDLCLTRPPYSSLWSVIPTQEEIQPFLPDYSKNDDGQRKNSWAYNHIGTSVMHDDFARYIIGTNSSISTWLNLSLSKPRWIKPKLKYELLEEFSSKLIGEEAEAWKIFKEAERSLDMKVEVILNTLTHQELKSLLKNSRGRQTSSIRITDNRKVVLKPAYEALYKVLSLEHTRQLTKIERSKDKHRQEPYFDLSQIQRYVLWRVFDLGWTTELFGNFDEHAISHYGREAKKAERIGKKYQWIAYHEILALISDHFQFRDRFSYGNAETYNGPWQTGMRDIDPTLVLRKMPGGTTWDAHTPAWWSTVTHNAWGEKIDGRKWVEQWKDLPSPLHLLTAAYSSDEVWYNLSAHFNWVQPTPPDINRSDVERREIWYTCTGYFVREVDVETFMKWAKTVNFMGDWMPKGAEVYNDLFMGEIGWSPASQHVQREYYPGGRWVEPEQDCPVLVQPLYFKYIKESGTVDCSVDETISLRMVRPELVTELGLRWTGVAADFEDATGCRVAFDPTAHQSGPSALLVQKKILTDYMQREKLTLCWTLIGEKQFIGRGWDSDYARTSISGAFAASLPEITGFINCTLEANSRVNQPNDIYLGTLTF